MCIAANATDPRESLHAPSQAKRLDGVQPAGPSARRHVVGAPLPEGGPGQLWHLPDHSPHERVLLHDLPASQLRLHVCPCPSVWVTALLGCADRAPAWATATCSGARTELPPEQQHPARKSGPSSRLSNRNLSRLPACPRSCTGPLFAAPLPGTPVPKVCRPCRCRVPRHSLPCRPCGRWMPCTPFTPAPRCPGARTKTTCSGRMTYLLTWLLPGLRFVPRCRANA